MSQHAANPGGQPDSLKGQFLIAMPTMRDKNFGRSVVYLCAHSDDGAMGLIINRIATDITFTGLLKQVRLQAGSDEADGTEDVGDDPGFPMTAIPEALANKQVHFGGPVEPNRGFVLHSDDYADDDMTLSVHDGICLTATIDVLHALLEGRGPSRILVALGYAGWSAGQLEAEIQANGWLHATGDADLIFDTQAADKYDQALARLGIDPAHLSGEAGHA